MPPPELSADAPVAYIFHPVAVKVPEFRRIEFDLIVHHYFQRGCGQVLHTYPPLQAQARFNNRIGTFTIAHFTGIILRFNEVSLCFQFYHYLLTGFKAVEADEDLCFRCQCAVIIKNVYYFQAVLLSKLVIIDIMCGRHFQCTATEIHAHIRICDDGYAPVDQGYKSELTLQVFVAFVVRVNTNGRITHDRLRAYRCNDNAFVAPLNGITKMI